MFRSTSIIAGLICVGLSTAAPVAAEPNSVPVQQVPATGTSISGLVVPAPWPASVHVIATEVPGEVELSVPTTPEVCATTIGGALVRIDFHNLAAGRSGSVTVNPCGHAVDPAPVVARAQTGSGFTQFGSVIVGSAAYPNAGQPAIPGTGSFLAP